MSTAKKAPLRPVADLPWTGPTPPPELGERGWQLWIDILHQYRDLSDAGGLEMLRQACTAVDRAESLRRLIAEQGEVLSVNGTLRAHPALCEELSCRAFAVRALARLGLDVEPVRPAPGRPSGGLGS